MSTLTEAIEKSLSFELESSNEVQIFSIIQNFKSEFAYSELEILIHLIKENIENSNLLKNIIEKLVQKTLICPEFANVPVKIVSIIEKSPEIKIKFRDLFIEKLRDLYSESSNTKSEVELGLIFLMCESAKGLLLPNGKPINLLIEKSIILFLKTFQIEENQLLEHTISLTSNKLKENIDFFCSNCSTTQIEELKSVISNLVIKAKWGKETRLKLLSVLSTLISRDPKN